jgi:hypothetical protein
MLRFTAKNNRCTGQMRDSLKTTGMGLGLVRLQMDVGRTEEARRTLASLQDDFRLLLHVERGALPQILLAGPTL